MKLNYVDNYVERSKGVIENQIIDLLEDRSAVKFIEITGEYGIGKTCLLAFVEKTLASDECLIFNISCDGNIGGKIALKNDLMAFVNRCKISKSKLVSIKPSKALKSILKLLEGSGISQIIDENLMTVRDVSMELCDDIERYSLNVVDIMKEVISHVERKMKSKPFLYVLIDDFNKLDCCRSRFVMNVLESLENVRGIIATSPIPTLDKRKKENIHSQVIVEQFKRSTSSLPVELSPFDLLDIKKYISNKNPTVEQLESIAKRAELLTCGIPLFLSIMCEDGRFFIESECEQNLDQKDLLLHYYQLAYHERNDLEKKILFYLSLNDGQLDNEVFSELFEGASRKTSLFADKIVEKKVNSVKIRLPALLKHIQKYESNAPDLTSSKKEILETYLNKSQENADCFFSVARLMREVQYPISEMYSYVISATAKLLNDFNPEGVLKVLTFIEIEKKLSDVQKSQIYYIKINALYQCKNLDKAIDVYKTLNQSVTFQLPEFKYSLQYKVAQAYYYKNQAQETLDLCRDILESQPENMQIFLNTALLEIATFDLIGDYDSSLNTYNKHKNIARNKDLRLEAHFSSAIQMCSSNYEECISQLINSTNVFSDTSSPERARCLNNLGIEYLMQGEFDYAERYLHESEDIFGNYFESYFVLNNLGLYYTFSDKEDYLKAESYLDRATRQAISPLQKAYTNMNLAILKFITNSSVDIKHIEIAEKQVKDCPDPLAKCYFNYNYARFLFFNKDYENSENHLLESCKYLRKPQVDLLPKKRLYKPLCKCQ